MSMFGSLVDSVKGAGAAAQARVATAQEGNKLLENGGPPMEHKVMAKYLCAAAVQADCVAMAQCDDVAKQLLEAAAAMEKAVTDASLVAALTPAEVHEFKSLSAAYKARAKAMNDATSCLKAGFFTAPVTSPVEKDAATILIVKGKAKYAKDRTNEVAQEAIDRANAAIAAASGPAPAPA